MSIREVDQADPVIVAHGLGSYPVYVAPDSLSRLGATVERHLDRWVVVLLG